MACYPKDLKALANFRLPREVLAAVKVLTMRACQYSYSPDMIKRTFKALNLEDNQHLHAALNNQFYSMSPISTADDQSESSEMLLTMALLGSKCVKGASDPFTAEAGLIACDALILKLTGDPKSLLFYTALKLKLWIMHRTGNEDLKDFCELWDGQVELCPDLAFGYNYNRGLIEMEASNYDIAEGFFLKVKAGKGKLSVPVTALSFDDIYGSIVSLSEISEKNSKNEDAIKQLNEANKFSNDYSIPKAWGYEKCALLELKSDSPRLKKVLEYCQDAFKRNPANINAFSICFYIQAITQCPPS
jgi:tetratricopeptide (TPR) repeat protein